MEVDLRPSLQIDTSTVTKGVFRRYITTIQRRARQHKMRPAIVEAFHETLGYCFSHVIQEMLGAPVRDEIFQLLERNRIPAPEVAVRFDDVVKVLTNAFGSGARVIIYKTVVELHREYFQPTEFPYGDSLRDRIDLLKERILSDLIKPRHLLSDDSYNVPSRIARE